MPSPTEHILVVEDDPSLAQWISDYLIEHQYQVSIATRGDIAVELVQTDMPDLVLLDIMLPVKNGFDVCKEIRQFYPRPILMMTACDDEVDEILGLELGADDYLNKPLKPRLLLARIKALLRRSQSSLNEAHHLELEFGNLQLLSSSKKAVLEGHPVNLTNNEFDVLWLLATNADTILSRTELISQLRGIDYDGFDRSIDIRISRIRKKFNDDSTSPKKIITMRGQGYLFASSAW